MVKRSLVAPDIRAGQQLVEALKQSDFRLEAALWWWQEERSTWRFVLATPIVHESGRIPAYDKLRLLASKMYPDAPAELLQLTDLVSPSESVITIFDLARSVETLPLHRLIEGEYMGGIWIEGAYIYYFEPRTFMTFEDSPD